MQKLCVAWGVREASAARKKSVFGVMSKEASNKALSIRRAVLAGVADGGGSMMAMMVAGDDAVADDRGDLSPSMRLAAVDAVRRARMSAVVITKRRNRAAVSLQAWWRGCWDRKYIVAPLRTCVDALNDFVDAGRLRVTIRDKLAIHHQAKVAAYLRRIEAEGGAAPSPRSASMRFLLSPTGSCLGDNVLQRCASEGSGGLLPHDPLVTWVSDEEPGLFNYYGGDDDNADAHSVQNSIMDSVSAASFRPITLRRRAGGGLGGLGGLSVTAGGASMMMRIPTAAAAAIAAAGVPQPTREPTELEYKVQAHVRRDVADPLRRQQYHRFLATRTRFVQEHPKLPVVCKYTGDDGVSLVRDGGGGGGGDEHDDRQRNRWIPKLEMPLPLGVE